VIAWPIALALGLLLFLFGVIVLSFAVCCEVLLAIRLVRAVVMWDDLLGATLTAAIAGTFLYMVARGAYLLSSDVVNGMSGRFLT
jgi:hypothetical protein